MPGMALSRGLLGRKCGGASEAPVIWTVVWIVIGVANWTVIWAGGYSEPESSSYSSSS
jgi:hypothetical protein